MSGRSTFLSNSSKEQWHEYSSHPGSNQRNKQTKPEAGNYSTDQGKMQFNLRKNLNESKQSTVEKKEDTLNQTPQGLTQSIVYVRSNTASIAETSIPNQLSKQDP